MAIVGLHQISADRFELAGRELVMIPGGRVALGLDQPIRTALQQAAPPAAFAAFDREGVIDNLEREPRRAGASFTPARVVTLAPFLIEIAARSMSSTGPIASASGSPTPPNARSSVESWPAAWEAYEASGVRRIIRLAT